MLRRDNPDIKEHSFNGFYNAFYFYGTAYGPSRTPGEIPERRARALNILSGPQNSPSSTFLKTKLKTKGQIHGVNMFMMLPPNSMSRVEFNFK